jgi:hypothetical protein
MVCAPCKIAHEPYTGYITSVTTFKPRLPPKRKPKPGQLPLEKEPERYGPPHPIYFATPPWDDPNRGREPEKERTPRKNFVKLKAAQKKLDELRVAVRDDAFDEWVRRCTTRAETPKEWTQAAALYANYLKRAKDYGWNKADVRLSRLELASETRFGILMRDAGFLKKRRAKGWFYPVRLKKGA